MSQSEDSEHVPPGSAADHQPESMEYDKLVRESLHRRFKRFDKNPLMQGLRVIAERRLLNLPPAERRRLR